MRGRPRSWRSGARARREVAPYLDVVALFDPTVDVPEATRAAVRGALEVGDLDTAAAAIPDHVLDRFAFAGTPQDVTRRVLVMFDAGASRVELGRPVLPAVRAAVSR